MSEESVWIVLMVVFVVVIVGVCGVMVYYCQHKPHRSLVRQTSSKKQLWVLDEKTGKSTPVDTVDIYNNPIKHDV